MRGLGKESSRLLKKLWDVECYFGFGVSNAWPSMWRPIMRPAAQATGQDVTRHGECERDAYAFNAAQHRLGDGPNRLAPAEYLLDPFADALAHRISGMSRGAAVERRALRFRRHMGRDVHGAQFIDETLRVIPLVGAKRNPVGAVGVRLDHCKRGFALSVTIGFGETGINRVKMLA